MTTAEAIAILRRIQKPEAWEPQINETAFEALDMAISALAKDTNVPSNETISRQDAIEAICTWDKFGVDERGRVVPWYEGLEPYVHLRDVVLAIENLPSAQPEIIRCRECKFASGDSRICMKFDHSPIGELDFCAWAERRTDEE